MGRALRYRQVNVARQNNEMARVRVIKGPDLGSTFVLDHTRFVLGRGEDADVVLTDLKASRHHAEIILDGSHWIIRDLGSANGILCNGVSTRQAGLTGKDVVTLSLIHI